MKQKNNTKQAREKEKKDKIKKALYNKNYGIINKEKISKQKKKYSDNPTRKAKKKEYSKTWSKTKGGSEWIRNYQLKNHYNITLDQYNIMLKKQKGLCAICKQPELTFLKGTPKSLGVDHNHTTGQIRSLLCASCNILIGHAREDAEILKSSYKYLNKWGKA